MHINEYLTHVITAAEAAQIWRLSRNAVTEAIKRGALPARRSAGIWLVTIEDMLAYQKGRYWEGSIPEDLEPVFTAALERYKKTKPAGAAVD